MAFHIYVDGPIERTAEATQRLAEAMCQRYGLRPSDLVSRLSRGRFRVKANLDRPTADAYAHELERIGARVVIEEARDSMPIPSHRADAVSLPPATQAPAPPPAPPPATRSADGDPPPSRPTPPGTRVIVAKPPGRPYAFVTPASGTPAPRPAATSLDPAPRATPPPSARRTTPASGSRTPSAPRPGGTPPAGQPVQDAGRGRGATPPTGQPGRGRGATPPTGQPVRGRGATPPTGQPVRGRGATPPTGQPVQDAVRGRGATPPTGQPVRGRGATPPTGQPVQGGAGVAPSSQRGTMLGLGQSSQSGAMPAPATTPLRGQPAQASGLRAAAPPGGSRSTATQPGGQPSMAPPGGAAPFSSGLAAAFSEQMPVQQLGALDADLLSLAPVEGLDTGAPLSVAAFEPPALAADGAPQRPTPPPDTGKQERPKDVPLDLFEPPDLDGPELEVELAVDEQEHQARKRASTPIPVDEDAAAAPAGRPSSPVLQRRSQPMIAQLAPVGAIARGAASPRLRFAAGIAIAIVLGFIPAHVIAAAREASAYRASDARVEQAQAAAVTPDAYARLDALRADELDRKRGEQRSIALTSMLVWAVLAGGLGYVWFRRIPWDRLARR